MNDTPTGHAGRRQFLKALSSGALLAVAPGMVRAAPASSGAVRVDGDWAVSLDRDDEGIAQGWFRRALHAPVPVRAALPAHRLGDPVSMPRPGRRRSPTSHSSRRPTMRPTARPTA